MRKVMSRSGIEGCGLQEYQKMQEAWKALQAARDHINLAIPELAARVFALRNISYLGHGFHYSNMEPCLGRLISLVNDDHGSLMTVREIVQRRIVMEARYEELVQKVNDAQQR